MPASSILGDSAGKLRFAADLAAADSIDELTRRLYAGIHSVFGSVLVGFDVLDPDTHRPQSTSAQGVSRFFLARYDQVAREADPVLQKAIASQALAYNLAMMSEAEWREQGVYRDVFSMHRMIGIIYAPVLVAGKVVATLNLGRTENLAPFSKRELRDAWEVARILSATVAAVQRRAALEHELRLFREALDLSSEAIVISDLQSAMRYMNRAAHAVLERAPSDGPSFDEALVELQDRGRAHRDDGLVERTSELTQDDAFVAFLRTGSRPDAPPEWLQHSLTSRELDVAALVAKGLRDQEIALQLNLSVHTVKGYLREAFRKTGARSRVELARMTVTSTP